VQLRCELLPERREIGFQNVDATTFGLDHCLELALALT